MTSREPAKTSPRITWLLPVRDGLPYLAETLASIEAQTYRNWQVLAWDNGSTDGTVEELQRWIPARLPGAVITDCPLPLADSLACLVDWADTELCARIDADDVATPDRLALQVRFLDRNADVAAVGGQLTLLDSEGRERPATGRFATRHADIVASMLGGPGLAHPAVLFRRSAILAVGNYRNVGPVNVEDYDLWLRLAARYRLANLPEVVLRYRVHDQSSTVISEREGALRGATRARFAEHAPALYGCTPREAALLASNRHPFALPVLWRMARSVSRPEGVSALGTLSSSKFNRGASTLLAPHDWATRAALWALRKRPLLFLRRVLGRDALSAASGSRPGITAGPLAGEVRQSA